MENQGTINLHKFATCSFFCASTCNELPEIHGCPQANAGTLLLQNWRVFLWGYCCSRGTQPLQGSGYRNPMCNCIAHCDQVNSQQTKQRMCKSHHRSPASLAEIVRSPIFKGVSQWIKKSKQRSISSQPMASPITTCRALQGEWVLA